MRATLQLTMVGFTSLIGILAALAVPLGLFVNEPGNLARAKPYLEPVLGLLPFWQGPYIGTDKHEDLLKGPEFGAEGCKVEFKGRLGGLEGNGRGIDAFISSDRNRRRVRGWRDAPRVPYDDLGLVSQTELIYIVITRYLTVLRTAQLDPPTSTSPPAPP